MIRMKYVLGFLMLCFAATGLHAGPMQPLVFEVTGEKSVVAAEYQVQDGQDPLQLHIKLGRDAVLSLQNLTKNNLGKKLVIKQGERILTSPTIKAGFQSNEIMLSFQTDHDRREFQEHTK